MTKRRGKCGSRFSNVGLLDGNFFSNVLCWRNEQYGFAVFSPDRIFLWSRLLEIIRTDVHVLIWRILHIVLCWIYLLFHFHTCSWFRALKEKALLREIT